MKGDGKLRKGSDPPSCSKCSTRLDAGRDGKSHGSRYHRVASICFWIGACDRATVIAARASDACEGGNREESAPRSIYYGHVCGWRDIHEISLGHMVSTPLWFGLEPGWKRSGFASACFYVIRNYGKVNYR